MAKVRGQAVTRTAGCTAADAPRKRQLAMWRGGSAPAAALIAVVVSATLLLAHKPSSKWPAHKPSSKWPAHLDGALRSHLDHARRQLGQHGGAQASGGAGAHQAHGGLLHQAGHR